MSRLVIALVTLLGLAAGTVLAGYLLLAGSTDRFASLAPARTAAYINVYLEPSPGQQMNLAGLISRLPGFADAAALDAKVDQIIGNLFSGAGIDYATDLQPWLGDQVAIAAWPSDDVAAMPEAVVIAAVKDRSAADQSVETLLGGDDPSFVIETYEGVNLHVGTGVAYAYVEDALLIGTTSDSLTAVVDVSGGAASLADQADFQAAMGRVPADNLASAFVDMQALMAVTDGTAEVAGLTTASAALIAETDGLRLTGVVPLDSGSSPSTSSESVTSTVVDWMPSDTLASAVLFGLPGALEDAESALGGTDAGDEALSMLDTIRALAAFGLGLDLDADLLPLLDGEAGIAITGLDGDLPHGQLILRPGDPDAAAGSFETIVDRLIGVGAERRDEDHDGVAITIVSVPDFGEISYAVTDGVVILGFAPGDVLAGVGAHASGASLGASERYREAFDVAGSRSGTEAYVDIGALIGLGVLDDAGVTLPDDAHDILSQLGALAISFPSRDDAIEFHAALTILETSAE
ncbi:MAG TPA: DUF3352 domain-containing protein [Candidatus Limnocylindria bacterium]